ncbi:MAG: sensor histidine kinase KdpD [Hyphomicrobiaceae bacterium]|nr:sensor histidine kinase KdpD [Hyphomicrobiaceae bacterium]
MADIQSSAGERRPSPKALLEIAAKETRGKLKVFLGAAPGVGKTYAMLALARAQQAEGIDVAVGVIETHGRPETVALLDGLDVLPRKTVTYRRHTLMEFDVEAAIARRPQLLLVDEFAHTNAPDQLHPKRYQDIEEILRAGIDVWTTLNIQHLESLTDVVQRITGVTVRETVPDKVLDLADEIVIVDLPPEELISRLKEGKVYLPDNARRAVDQFFKPGNLTALRELALRRTTDRVDEQMLAHLRQQGIEGAWPTAERLLVCVGRDVLSEKTVRAAARMASALKSDWIALHVSASDCETTDKAGLRRMEKALRLAERLGATSARVSGSDLVGEILRYARRNNITQIVVGRSGVGRVQQWFGRSLSHQLVETAQDVSVTVVAPEDGRSTVARWTWPAPPAYASALLPAAAAVGIAVLIGKGIENVATLPNLSMVFLFGVVACALRFGVWSALAAAVLSFFAYNFFFIAPRYTFTIAAPHELFSLFIFLVVAVVIGGLAGRLREQANATRDRAEATQTLYDFSRKLSGAASQDDVLWLLASQSAAAVKGSSIILTPDGHDLAIASGWPPEDTLATPDRAAARWALKERQPSGRFTTTLPTARFHYRPMLSSGEAIAVVGVEMAQAQDDIPDATAAALQSLIEQGAIAIERTRLVEVAGKVETAAEGERLRAALLSSISHDLRTPLASIVGSATGLRTLGEKMTAQDRAELLTTIEEEAGRLSTFVSNILEMTKLEAGAIDIRRDEVDVAEAVRGAAVRANKVMAGRKIELTSVRNLPPVLGDAALLEQVIFNLLDNAHKYSALGTPTEVSVARGVDTVTISVTDQGTGVPAGDLEKVFDKFYRVNPGDGRAPGTGLGLSICAALVTAMGGSITAHSPVAAGRGTRISIVLPAATGTA